MANREESPRFKWPFPSWKADWQEWQQIFRDLVNNIDAALFGMVEAQYLIFKELPDVQIVETSPGVYQFIPSAQAVFISRTNHVEIRTTEDRLTLQPDAFVVVALTPGAVGPQVVSFELVQQGMDISPNLIPLGYVGTDYSIYWYNGSHLPVGKMMRLFETGEGGGGEVRKAAVLSIADCTLPPPTENLHDRYILDMTGPVHADWDGAAQNDIVDFGGVSWLHETPEEGWVCLVDDADVDAVFVDDPPVPAHWENRVIPVGVWDAGAGVSAIKRTADLVGLADGDYALNAGWGGNAEADYSFNGNGANVITDDSSYSTAFGDANVVGDTLRSRYSLIAGHGNSVNGYNDRGDIQGDNAVFGRAHVVNAQRCVVGGFGNIVDFVGNAVFGRDNTVPGFYSLVFGRDNVLSSTLSFGFISGYDNTGIGSDFGMVVGEGNDVGLVNGSAYSVIVGYQNHVDGTGGGWNYVFGYGNDVDSDFISCFGYSHNVLPNSNYTAVFGYGHAIGPIVGSPDSIVAGRTHTVNGVAGPGVFFGGNAVFGDSNNLNGDYNIIAGRNQVVGEFGDCQDSAIFGYGNYVVTNCYGVLISGYSNEITTSPYSAIFGSANKLGQSQTSPYSIVAGRLNEVNGNSGSGDNAVFGFANYVSGYKNIVAGSVHQLLSWGGVPNTGMAVFGIINSVRGCMDGLVAGSGNVLTESDYCAVHGTSNTVGNYCDNSLIAGSFNLVDANGVAPMRGHCYVFGRENNIDCDYSFAFGYLNTVSVNNNLYTAVFGRNNSIGASVGSPDSIIAGSGHTVNGFAGPPPFVYGSNAVFGEANQLTGHHSIVAGINAILSACDYSAVFGYGQTVTSHQFGIVAGGWNTVVSSQGSAVFGNTNSIGATKSSPFSLVAGESNSVDASTTSPMAGHNYVFGKSNNVDCDYSMVFGYSNTVSDIYGAVSNTVVFGNSNTVGNLIPSPQSIIVGSSNTVNGFSPMPPPAPVSGNNAVFGGSNTVNGHDIFMAGNSNAILAGGGDYSAVFGYSHILQTNSTHGLVSGFDHTLTNAKYCVVGGYQNTVAGFAPSYNGANAVFGRSNVVTSEYSLVAGYTNIVSGSGGSCVVGGSNNTVNNSNKSAIFGQSNNVVFGNQCAVFGQNNIVNGQYHVVGGSYNLVTGVSACAVFGRYNEIGYSGDSLVYGAYARVRWMGSLVAANGYNDWGSGPRRAQTLANMPIKGFTRSSPVEWVSFTGYAPNPMPIPIRLHSDQACFWQMDVVATKENVTPGLPALKSWTVKFLTYLDSAGAIHIPISTTVEAMTNNSDEVSWDIRVRVIPWYSSAFVSIEGWGSDDASNAVAWSIRLRNTEVNAMQFNDA